MKLDAVNATAERVLRCELCGSEMVPLALDHLLEWWSACPKSGSLRGWWICSDWPIHGFDHSMLAYKQDQLNRLGQAVLSWHIRAAFHEDVREKAQAVRARQRTFWKRFGVDRGKATTDGEEGAAPVRRVTVSGNRKAERGEVAMPDRGPMDLTLSLCRNNEADAAAVVERIGRQYGRGRSCESILVALSECGCKGWTLADVKAVVEGLAQASNDGPSVGEGNVSAG